MASHNDDKTPKVPWNTKFDFVGSIIVEQST